MNTNFLESVNQAMQLSTNSFISIMNRRLGRKGILQIEESTTNKNMMGDLSTEEFTDLSLPEY